MKKYGFIAALLIVAIAGASLANAADAPKKKGKRKAAAEAVAAAPDAAAPKVEKKDPVGYKDTPMLPGGKWHVHDTDRPHPPIVTPGEKLGDAPSDAVVLFDGKGLDKWVDGKGQPTKWIVKDGAMECVPKSGFVQTKDKFGDCQLHVEFANPTPPKGNSQGRGNSGVFLGGGKYEIQVLDSYDNVTYADGQCGAVYGQMPPQVNISRKPGEWQTYDIIFRYPKFDEAGKVVKPAFVTVFQNGVLMQEHTEILGGTGHKIFPTYKAHEAQGAIQFQDHGNPVRYRNVWIRQLRPIEEFATKP